MQSVLIIAAVAGVFVFSFFLMKKLDASLENNCPANPENRLRIGFSDPTAADGLTDALERFSRTQPEASVCLFTGTEDELLKRLSERQLDLVFLPEDTGSSGQVHCRNRRIMLSHAPVDMKYGGLPIEPVARGRVSQAVFWPEAEIAPCAGCFLECLENGNVTPERRKLQ